MQGSQQSLLINESQRIRFDCDRQSLVLLDLTECGAGIVVTSSNDIEVDSIELGGELQFTLLRRRGSG